MDRSHPDRAGETPLEDRDLVRRTLAGDPRAEERFVRRMRCVPRMVAAKNARLGRPLGAEEVEDVAQEAMTAIWRKLENFDGRGPLEVWVYRFCFFELLRKLRNRRGLPGSLEEVGTDREPLAPEIHQAVDHEHVHESLERLDDDVAVILRLKHFEDLTFEALSSRLGISPNTAKARYYRGLRQLKRWLAKTEQQTSGEKA